MRRFFLERIEDESGVSGTGIVAEGTEFTNGKCVLCWRTFTSSIGVYDDLKSLVNIHGHNGKTIVRWLDVNEIEQITRKLETRDLKFD
jgi:hypothetical protein